MFVLKGLLLYVKLIYCKVNIYWNLSILGYCKTIGSDMSSKCTISVHLAKSVAELEFVQFLKLRYMTCSQMYIHISDLYDMKTAPM